MRHFSKILLFAVIVSTAFYFTSCAKDDTTNDTPKVKTKHELLMDAMWYNTDGQGVGDRRFNTDGTFQFYNPNATGTYTWGPNDSMYINITTPPGAPPMTYWFKTVTATNMEYWPTFEPSSNIYKFSKTKP